MPEITENVPEQNPGITGQAIPYVDKIKYGIYAKYIKRPMDFTLALLALIVFSPVMLIIALLVRLKLGNPVLFKQDRPGKDEKVFKLYKFRTMTDKRDENGDLLPDSERLTRFGKFLRSTSIDELPELINILQNKMSIVGPRPLAVQYIPYYNDFQKMRHSILPGLTGWAQVNGRNAVTWENRFSHDIEYITNISFQMDIRIIFMTVACVFRRSGIGERGIDSLMDFDEYIRQQQREKEVLR